MSEVQTSPAPAEAAPVADSGVVESPTPSGNTTEQPMEELSSAPKETTTEELPDERPEPWDHTTWDGNLDNLPEHLQAPVQFLHKNLESGYTKKFQPSKWTELITSDQEFRNHVTQIMDEEIVQKFDKREGDASTYYEDQDDLTVPVKE